MKRRRGRIAPGTAGLGLLVAFLLTGCASTRAPSKAPTNAALPAAGVASYYSKAFDGRRTASGERYDIHQLTAAHRTLPFGARVRVTNLTNLRSVVVRINDRGPFARGRIIDVSLEAARRLQMTAAGTVQVRIEPL